MNDSTACNDQSPYPAPREAWYVVTVLMICYVFSFIDRQIVAFMVGPIKRDLGLSDIQIGLFQGPAFAILYTCLGIPIARAADKFNRRNIIALGVFVWSLAATYCGMAKSAMQIFVGRIGVGVGEAALSPAAYSTMTDLFPREKQSTAFSVYNIGITIGSGIASIVSGIVVAAVSGQDRMIAVPLLGEVRAWQLAFIFTGLPGILLPLLLLTYRDPARRGLMRAGLKPDAVAAPSVLDVFKFTWRSRAFYSRHFLAYGFLAMVGYGVGAWLPEALHRTYGMAVGTIGKLLGVGLILINTPCVLLFGKASDVLTRKGRRDAPVIMCLVAACGTAIFCALPYAMPNAFLAWVMIYIGSIPFHGYIALSPMIATQVAPNQMRAQVASLCLFVVNLLGLAVGPQIPPLLTRLFFNDESQIRWGLMISIVAGSLVAALLYASERNLYRQKLDEAAAWH